MPPVRRWNDRTQVLTIIAVILLALSIALTVALLVVRTDDLSDVADEIRRQVAAHDVQDQADALVRAQQFCTLLTTYQVAPPSTPYGRELARRSRELAVTLKCQGVS